MANSGSSRDEALGRGEVEYRASRQLRLRAAGCAFFSALCFWFATSILVGDGSVPTSEEVTRGHVQDSSILVWMAFVYGLILLGLVLFGLWSAFFFQVKADEKGLRWRRFVAWHSARWDEVTDCFLAPTPNLLLGKRRLSFDKTARGWPQLRDFIAAHVRLPDDVSPWHEGRIRAPKPEWNRDNDDGAPLFVRSGTWWVAIVGLLPLLMFAFTLHADPTGARPSDFVSLAVALGFFFVYPLALEVRCFLRCDDEGLLIGQLWRQRRVPFGAIDDLFLLRRCTKNGETFRPCVEVNGETIALSPLGKHRPQILARIERGAKFSRSRSFQKRDFAPLGRSLSLPATLGYRAVLRSLRWNSAFLLLFGLALVGGMGAIIAGLGWENFSASRGVLVWASLMFTLAGCWWARRTLGHVRRLRARLDERLDASERGLSFQSPSALRLIEWQQISRLERDCDAAGNPLLRVHGAGGSVIEFDPLLPRASLLALLCLERSGSSWNDSPRLLRRVSGLTREGERLEVSENNLLSRYWAALWLGMWALIPSMVLCNAPFEANFDVAGFCETLLFFVVPPLGFALFLGLAALVSIRRTRTVCDERGLWHQGWFASRFLSWAAVEEVGSTGGVCDFVRARDGQTIRMALFPATEAGRARRELREEIRRCAPHARGGWKTK